jgi:hypothetical protein
VSVIAAPGAFGVRGFVVTSRRSFKRQLGYFLDLVVRDRLAVDVERHGRPCPARRAPAVVATAEYDRLVSLAAVAEGREFQQGGHGT